MEVKRFINEPVPSNCYVFYNKAVEGNCIVVDPGSRNNAELKAFLDENSLTPGYIILTHEHFDHIWGVNELVSLYSVPVVCSEPCSQRIKDSFDNCSALYDDNLAVEINSKIVSTESLDNELVFGKETIKFFYTPGHSDASISFLVCTYLFTGDTLIKDERTMTKLPTGSKERLRSSMGLYAQLRGKGYTVYPGHGEKFELDEYDLQKMWVAKRRDYLSKY